MCQAQQKEAYHLPHGQRTETEKKALASTIISLVLKIKKRKFRQKKNMKMELINTEAKTDRKNSKVRP